MSTAQVNYLNIGLMLVSAIAAFIIPFELFLFSYAVLGPLHYLTEISWLHKRQYFSPKKRDYIPLVIITLLIAIPAIVSYIVQHNAPVNAEGKLMVSDGMMNFLRFLYFENPSTALIFMAFAISAVMVLLKDTMSRIVAFIVIIMLGIILRSNHFVDVMFALFLPTLIHVFIFTGAFILVGALKSNSTSGLLSIIVFFGCAISFFLIMPGAENYQISEYAKGSYDVSFFNLNESIFKTFLHVEDPSSDMIYNSSAGILITRFIAYAYTYHYLNWFSKTSVIKWHEVPRLWLITILVLWVSAVGLYLYNYEVGLMCLYFLSFLHVVLEFPLNFQSFKQIGEQIRMRLGRKVAGS